MYHSKFKRSSNQTVRLKISLAYLIENIQFYTFRFRLITSAGLQFFYIMLVNVTLG
ncbi:unnamed protein product, partial [Rotaria magnacalcarata]